MPLEIGMALLITSTSILYTVHQPLAPLGFYFFFYVFYIGRVGESGCTGFVDPLTVSDHESRSSAFGYYWSRILEMWKRFEFRILLKGKKDSNPFFSTDPAHSCQKCSLPSLQKHFELITRLYTFVQGDPFKMSQMSGVAACKRSF